MKNVSTLTLVLILVMLLTAMSVSSEDEYYRPGQTKMTVFLQEFRAGPNATLIPVAGAPGMPRDISHFGTILVDDVLVTEGQSINSSTVGRVRGINVISSLNATAIHVSVSIVFTNQKYNGSTLELQGLIQVSSRPSEVSIGSGTKKFRFARGYATFQQIFEQPSANYYVVRVDLVIVQYYSDVNSIRTSHGELTSNQDIGVDQIHQDENSSSALHGMALNKANQEVGSNAWRKDHQLGITG